MSEGFEQILYAIDEGVLTITVNRPERLNAWTETMMLAHRADSRVMLARGQSAAEFPDRVNDGLPDVFPGWSPPDFR